MGFTLTDVLLFGGAKESDVDNAAFVIMRRNILRWGAIGGYVSIVVHGVSPLILPDAIANSLSYVKAFGGTEQNGTPTPDAPVDIVSNNGVLKWDSVNQKIYTDGTVETINVHTKNLFDENDVILGYFYNDSGTYTSNGSTYTSGKIPMDAGTTVTFSRGLVVASVYLRIHAFDSNDNWIGLVAKSSTSSGLSCTGTTPANTSYIRVCGAKKAASTSTEIDHECQVEFGSTATEYAPYYDGGTATAEMLLKVGDYQDEQEILSGAVTRNVGIKVLDGTEDWKDQVSSFHRVYITIPTVLNASTGAPVYCSHAPYVASTNPNLWHVTLLSGGLFSFWGITSLDAFKSWLADQYANGTPVIIVYPLATPTTESVSGQTLQVTSGDNVLEITQASLTGLELEAQYNAAVSLTIQEVEDANLDNNVTVTIQ